MARGMAPFLGMFLSDLLLLYNLVDDYLEVRVPQNRRPGSRGVEVRISTEPGALCTWPPTLQRASPLPLELDFLGRSKQEEPSRPQSFFVPGQVELRAAGGSAQGEGCWPFKAGSTSGGCQCLPEASASPPVIRELYRKAGLTSPVPPFLYPRVWL